MPVMEDKYLTAEEVAEKLRKAPETMMRLFREKKIPGAFKFGGEWRISERDLNKYIEKLKQQ